MEPCRILTGTRSFDLLGTLYKYLCDTSHTLLTRENCDEHLGAILKDVIRLEMDFSVTYILSPSMITLEKAYETCNNEKVKEIGGAFHLLDLLRKCYNLRNKADTLTALRQYKRSALAYNPAMNAEKIDLLMKLDTPEEAMVLYKFDVEEYQVKQNLIWEVFETELDLLIDAATDSKKENLHLLFLKNNAQW